MAQSWTEEDLKSIDQAISEGVRKVKFNDKEVEYRTLNDMITIRNFIAKQLGLHKSNGSDSFGKPITMVFNRE